MAERLISADALRKSMAEWYDGVQAFTGADIIDVIDNAPTVDAVPVVHGEWIDRNGSIVAPFWERYECSECGARSDNSKYCPNCGARMDADETES